MSSGEENVGQPAEPNQVDSEELEHLCLVEGGPLYRLYLRCGLLRPPFDNKLVILAAVLITWLPLFILSLWAGRVRGGPVPFLDDVAVHVRCLVALPIFLETERVVWTVIPMVVSQFLENQIIQGKEVARFKRGIHAVSCHCRSTPIAVLMLFLIVGASYVVRQEHVGLGTSTWYQTATGSGARLTPAGYWFAFVSLPICQFIQLQWYVRLILWFGFLWRVSRLKLHLVPTHPDRAAGIGFLGQAVYPFASVALAQGALTTGLIANRVLHRGETLKAFQLEIITLVLILVVLILGPLTVFSFQLAQAKWRGLREYGHLADRYVREFERKWIRGEAPPGEALLGSSDIQSLADIGNSFAVLRVMRPVPFGVQEIALIPLLTLAPMLPLALLVVPLDVIINHVLKAFL